jgi:hypothetical protein
MVIVSEMISPLVILVFMVERIDVAKGLKRLLRRNLRKISNPIEQERVDFKLNYERKCPVASR